VDGDGDIIPIIADGDDGDLEDVEVPETIPILSLRNNVLFPGVVLPISIGRPRSIQLIKDAYRNNKIVGTVAQKDPDTENPEYQDLHTVGTIGQIVKLLEMPDGSTTAIIQDGNGWYFRNWSPIIHTLLQKSEHYRKQNQRS